MAEVPRLDTLPDELIAHIASSADAPTVLRLSRISLKLRRVCYDVPIFKAILEASEQSHWNRASWYRNSSYMQLIESVAGQNVQTWARYALADYQANDLPSNRSMWLEVQENPRSWLPELYSVKHPILYRPNGSDLLREGPSKKALQQEFCQALAILAREDLDCDEAKLRSHLDPKLERGVSATTFMTALCSITLALRAGLRTRLAAWPYNSAAQNPYIQPPRVSHVHLNPDAGLPLPFSTFRKWKSWYEGHNESLFRTPSYFTDGPWAGYYTHFGFRHTHVDPPMTNINFRIVPTPSYRPDELSLQADDCRDGVGPYSVTGGFTHSEDDSKGEVEFTAVKQYLHSRTRWLWDLRVTPFGMVGFWGTDEFFHHGHSHAQTGIQRMGLVWLWKEAWTRDA